jgi:hypothetical protein
MIDRYSYAYYPQSVWILSGLFLIPLAIPFAILTYAKSPLAESLGYLVFAIVTATWVCRTLLYQSSDIVLYEEAFARFVNSSEWLRISWSDIESVETSIRTSGSGVTVTRYTIRIRRDAKSATGKTHAKIQADMVRREAFNEAFMRHLRNNNVALSTH